MSRLRQKNLRCSARGSTLSEFGPALFLIFVFGLLPTLDALFIGVDYAAVYYLNELQLREAQKLPKSKATAMSGPIIAGIPMDWSRTLLAGLLDKDQPIASSVSYRPVPWQPVGNNQTLDFWFVEIKTTVSFHPFLTIPFFTRAPALGAPISVSVAGRRPVENNRFLSQ